jgi:subtilisin family serine protease
MRFAYWIACILLFFSVDLIAQNYYWIGFTDKNNTPYSLTQPESYLSERAIERRIKQNIPIDSLDLPVNPSYIGSVLSHNFTLIHSSKWLNGITVSSNNPADTAALAELSFIREIRLSKPGSGTKSIRSKLADETTNGYAPIDTSAYGQSVHQVSMLNAQYLHNDNYKGQGIHIAVLDGGFLNTDMYPAFDSLWANQQIIGTKDFVEPGSDIFNTHYHGMSVLSCMGGNIPGQLVGTAPKASYWLLRSEDTSSEYIIEEDNWVAAAEFADSAGVDIINSSLGYYNFDDVITSHTYAEMDGNTTRVTRAANIAFSRGMLVFSSAGNEGNDPWKYIIAPSDGDNVMGVGAVDKNRNPAYFTSFGPAADGDIKPNVAALGYNAVAQKADGSVGFINGTSFSSPIMAGTAACLWQKHPGKTAIQIKEAIEKSAHKYDNPDSLLGFGIPDMQLADSYLNPSSVASKTQNRYWRVYPNPVSDFLVVQCNTSQVQNLTIILTDIWGSTIKTWNYNSSPTIVLNDIPRLNNAIYFLQINSPNHTETFKISTAVK